MRSTQYTLTTAQMMQRTKMIDMSRKKRPEPLIVRTGADIKKMRQEAGFTQQSLAIKLKIARVVVTKWESGKENLTLEAIARIANACDKKVKVVFGEENSL